MFTDEILELRADDGALGLPEDQALADGVVDGEEAELRADDAVVALLRLFELLDVLIELFFVEEGGAVDALELVGGDVPVPVRLGDAHDLEALDAAGRGDVRALAEVFPILPGLAGGVPTQRPRPLLDGLPGVINFVLVALGLEARHAFVDGQVVPRERPILLHDLGHLRLDPREVVGRDRCVQGDVVIKPVLQRRAVRQLRLRPQALDGLGHDVGGGVAQNGQGVRVAVGQDGNGVIAAQLRRKVDDLSIDLRRHRRLRKPPADPLGELPHCAPVGDLPDRTVWKSNVRHWNGCRCS
jgi:hypothetical protein